MPDFCCAAFAAIPWDTKQVSDDAVAMEVTVAVLMAFAFGAERLLDAWRGEARRYLISGFSRFCCWPGRWRGRQGPSSGRRPAQRAERNWGGRSRPAPHGMTASLAAPRPVGHGRQGRTPCAGRRGQQGAGPAGMDEVFRGFGHDLDPDFARLRRPDGNRLSA